MARTPRSEVLAEPKDPYVDVGDKCSQEQSSGREEAEFQEHFESGIGDEYAIWSQLAPRLTPGCKIVLLSKDEELRAEGELVELVPKSKTGSGIQRYDVHIRNLKMVPYKAEQLNRNGVALSGMAGYFDNDIIALSRVAALRQGILRENRSKFLAAVATFSSYRDPSTANQFRIRETDSPLRMTLFGA